MGQLQARGVDLVRINLSHVPVGEIEDYIRFLQRFNIPVALDTEGSQIRTGKIPTTTGTVRVRQDSTIRVYGKDVDADERQIRFTPDSIIRFFKPGDMIAIDFNSVLLKVTDVSRAADESYVTCQVCIGGEIGSNKGVHCYDSSIDLPTFSDKDYRAFELAKQYGIRHFTLSFIDNESEVKRFREILPDAVAYAKIETLSGVKNVEKILQHVQGILIDRGDLSRDIPIEKIPLTQKLLINTARRAGKDVLVASNLLETMATELKPSRAEANDIVNTVLDGVTGFVLTKETAVGRYPVQTVNMLANLARQAGLAMQGDAFSKSADLEKLRSLDYAISRDLPGFLNAPHGGHLVDRCEALLDADVLAKAPRLGIDENTLLDLEQIAVGAYSPLEGFMTSRDLDSVLSDMRLSQGAVWTVPIILPITAQDAERIRKAKTAVLAQKSNGRVCGTIEVEEIFPFPKSEYASKVFGTQDRAHPGIQWLETAPDFLVGGKISYHGRPKDAPFSHHRLTPRQSRGLFEAMGWSQVVGFHARNVAHRSHEFIQMRALERTGCDGLFVHPVVGQKKPGDFDSEMIVLAYEEMVASAYPKGKVIFGVFPTYSRYAGPREAIFTALCRKNYGCSHFIVGRDHTGVGNFYSPKASQEIFERLGDIGIRPVFFDEVGFSQKDGCYKELEHADGEQLAALSGTKVREMLKQRQQPPEWLMRPEISRLLLEAVAAGKKIFVE